MSKPPVSLGVDTPVLTDTPTVFVWTTEWAASTTYVWIATGWFPTPTAA